MTDQRAVLLALIGTITFIFGCTEDLPTANEPLTIEVESAAERSSLSTRRVFVGRDSAGIVLEGHLAGASITHPDRCGPGEMVSLSGRGNVTHLGKTEAELSHCYNASASEVTEGKLVLTGRTGGSLQGTYEGEQTQKSGAFSVDVTIDGGSIEATMVDNEEGEATLSGTVHSNGTFKADLSGWLLQHLRSDLVDN